MLKSLSMALILMATMLTGWLLNDQPADMSSIKTEEDTIYTDKMNNEQWIPALWEAVTTDGFSCYTEDSQLFLQSGDSGEKRLISENFSSDVENGDAYLLYDGEKVFYTEFADGFFRICAVQTETLKQEVLYQVKAREDTIPDNSEIHVMPYGQLYLAGMCGDELFFYENVSGNTILYSFEPNGKGEKKEITAENVTYLWADNRHVIRIEGHDNSCGELIIEDRETGNRTVLSKDCRIPNGNYLSGEDFYYLDREDPENGKTSLVCYDLQANQEKSRIELPKDNWYAWQGCFYRYNTDTRETELLLYDGSILTAGPIQTWLLRYEEQFCSLDRSLHLMHLNEGSREWEEWLNLADFGISFPYSHGWALELTPLDGGMMILYLDEDLTYRHFFLHKGE